MHASRWGGCMNSSRTRGGCHFRKKEGQHDKEVAAKRVERSDGQVWSFICRRVCLLCACVCVWVGCTRPVFWVIKLSQQTEAKQHQPRKRMSDWLTVWSTGPELLLCVCLCLSSPRGFRTEKQSSHSTLAFGGSTQPASFHITLC